MAFSSSEAPNDKWREDEHALTDQISAIVVDTLESLLPYRGIRMSQRRSKVDEGTVEFPEFVQGVGMDRNPGSGTVVISLDPE